MSDKKGAFKPASAVLGVKAVKLDKLTKKLSRDLAANPKKAGLLSLMVVVALYFWFPLLKDMIPLGGGAKTAQAANVILTDDPGEPSGSGRKPKETLKWEKVRLCVVSDPWMSSAVFDTAWHDPFAVPSPPVAEAMDSATATAEDEAEAVAAAGTLETEVQPAEAGLSVASVAIGPRMRAVTIAGDVYREKEVIAVTAPNGEQLEFRIVSIAPHEVQVERNGKVYRLELSRPRLAKGDRIAPITTSGDSN